MSDSPGWASPGSDHTDTSRPDRAHVPGPAGEAEPPDVPRQDAPPRDAEPQEAAPRDARQQDTEPQDAAPGATPPQWSKNQPPPGNWAAQGPGDGPVPPTGGGGRVPPPPPGPAPRPRQAGQPGWGWGATAGGPNPYWAPPPPKPGVIPLRPLAVGEIFEGAFSTARTHWRTVLGISSVVGTVTAAASTVTTGLFFNHNPGLDKLRDESEPSLSDVAHVFGNILAGSTVTLVIALLGQIVATAMLIMVVSRSVIGRPVTAGEVWSDARPRFLRMLGLTLMVVLITTMTFGVGVVPGALVGLVGSPTAGTGLAVLGALVTGCVALWLLISLGLAPPVLMLEKQGVFAALSRSIRLVRGSWWRVFGIQGLATLLSFIINAIVQIPFSVIATIAGAQTTTDMLATGSSPVSWAALVLTGISTAIGAAFALPLSAGITSLLYIDQRIRREALDIELARAAGITDYGTK